MKTVGGQFTTTWSKSRTYIRLIVAVVICQVAGMIGSLFTTPSIASWYAALRKPDFTPPNWLFGPVWTTLYLLMGISFYIIWNASSERRNPGRAIAIFAVQLALNILWSYLFFALRSPRLGLIEIIAMWVAILATIISFSKILKTSALMLVPYLIWVSLASYLNYMIVVLNP